MSNYESLATARLRLRRWRAADREPFAQINADPAVMEYFPRPLTPPESDALIERIEQGFDSNGFGLWAVEAPGVAPLLGFVGLARPGFKASFTPCVEVGWRLARAHWGRGYAVEAARAALAFGFDRAGLDQIVSFTAAVNDRSQRVMQKLGLDFVENFEHPGLPPGDRLRPHVLYRLQRRRWEAAL